MTRGIHPRFMKKKFPTAHPLETGAAHQEALAPAVEAQPHKKQLAPAAEAQPHKSRRSRPRGSRPRSRPHRIRSELPRRSRHRGHHRYHYMNNNPPLMMLRRSLILPCGGVPHTPPRDPNLGGQTYLGGGGRAPRTSARRYAPPSFDSPTAVSEKGNIVSH